MEKITYFDIEMVTDKTSSESELLSSNSDIDDQIELDLPHLAQLATVAKTRDSKGVFNEHPLKRRGAISLMTF